MADDLVIRKPALYRYAVRLLVDVLYQMGCDMRQTFRVNDTDIHAWNHFIERYTSATEVFTRRFILFQLQCRYGERSGLSRKTLSRTRLTWLVSKAAIKSWEKVYPTSAARFVAKGLKSRFDVSTLKSETELPALLVRLIDREEKAKAAFYGANKGFAWCIVNTTLYHHRSPWCATCKFKEQCKKLLGKNYPLVYKIRGYA